MPDVPEIPESVTSTSGSNAAALRGYPWTEKLIFAAKMVGVVIALASPAAATGGWALNEAMESRDRSFSDLTRRVDRFQETLDRLERTQETLRGDLEQHMSANIDSTRDTKGVIDTIEDDVTAVGHALQLVRTEIRFRHATSRGAPIRAARASREAGEVLSDL